MPALQTLPQQPKIRKFWPTIITLIVFVLIGVFVWRVGHYTELIQSGELLDLNASYAKQMSISRLASAASANASGAAIDSADDPSIGSKDASLTIVEFADFGCPYSQQVSFLMRSLAHEYGDRVRYVYRDFPLIELHPEAQLAAEAGECAQDQGKFWELHDKFYQNQSDLSEEAIIQYAREIGLDMGQFLACLSVGVHRAEVQEDYQAGLSAGVVGTPTFFFNGAKVDGAIPADVMRALIQQLTDGES